MQLSRTVHVIPATRRQEPVLANLVELYIHDFSEFLPVDLGPDGRFGNIDLPDYWTEPDHHPFLITVEGQLAGFALIKKSRAVCPDHQVGEDPIWDMAEFFVVRAYRKRGVGLAAAHQVWRLFPGPWQIRVMDVTPPAMLFWQGAIDSFTGRYVAPAPINRDGRAWAVFMFDSNA